MSAETELRLVVKTTNPQALAALSRVHGQLGTTGFDAFDRVRKSAKEAGQEVERVGQFGKFSFQVLQAFLLYKGFVFLKTQAEQFTRELVNMEHQVALTQTQLNNLGKDFRPLLSENTVRVARETGIAFTSLAATQYEVISANIGVSDSFRVLELSAKASVAGGLTDAKQAFNAALTQVNAFGLSIQDLDKVYDKQFNLVKRGIFTYQQFAQVSGEVSIAFAQIGQSVEVANASLAAVSQIFTGGQIGEGATGLKNAALALNENADAFERLGFKVHDEEGNFRNFIDIVNELNESLQGMSPKDREAVLIQLFDEKRARRGINVLLKEIDNLNLFYVEQQFALGDLDDALQTMNESLLQQANIFKNELTPAFEPFLRVLQNAMQLLNGMGSLVGGPANLAVLAMAAGGGAALGAANRAALARGSGFQPSTVAPGTMVPLPGGGFTLAPGPIGGFRGRMMAGGLPTTPTLALGGLGGLLAFHQGQQQGPAGFGGALATVGGAGLGGLAFGGPAGAAAFGGLAAAGLVLGELMEKQAPETAKSFAEAFRDALIEDSDDVAAAFTKAVTESLQPGQLAGLRDTEVLFGTTGSMASSPFWQAEAARARARGDPGFAEQVMGGQSFTNKPSIQGLIQSGTISKIIQQAKEAEEFARETQPLYGVAPQDARATFVRTQVEGLEAGKTVEAFVNAIVEARLTPDKIEEVFRILQATAQLGPTDYPLIGGDPGVALAAKQRQGDIDISGILSGKSPDSLPDTLAQLTVQIEGLITGSVDPLANIFDELGASGKAAADAWREVADTMQRYKTFQELLDLKMMVERQPFTTKAAPGFGPGATFTTFGAPEKLETGILDIINENFKHAPITDEDIARRFFEALQKDIGDAFGKSFTGLSRDEFLQFLTGDMPQQMAPAVELMIPGMTGLADQLEAAQQAIEDGFLVSTYYSTEQLGELGASFEAFNKTIFKVGVIEELQRLGEIAGYGADRFKPAIEQLVRNIHLGGLTFADVMADPTKLADLLAELEFGDVQIDQSTNMQVTLRFEGDFGTQSAVEFADQVMAELNRLAREQNSR